MSVTRPAHADFTAARAAIAGGQSTATALLEASVDAANGPSGEHAFIRRFDGQARAVASAVDALRVAGAPLAPLAGLSVSVKDLFDVAGQPTTGGSKALFDAPPAAEDSRVVARLRRAGAALIGQTNLSEFAFSGVGINPHHGTPANAGTLTVDAVARIPGGSTSGGAVSVACGAAWAALGSDTGGSIRIPAALQGLVGFKPTQRLVPLEGSIPLSTTLDTACAVTLSVRDAVTLHAILSDSKVELTRRPIESLRLAVPTTLMLEGLEPSVARNFERALKLLSHAGARIETIQLPELTELAAINAQGGFSAAESWAWHRGRLAERGDDYDPRVALRIRRGQQMSAADYLDLLRSRSEWIARVSTALRGFDAALSPTVPLTAPPLAPLLRDDEAFFAVNARLLRNTSPVNFLDGCGLSLPCQAPGELPVGLMVWASAMHDETVLDVSLTIERVLAAAGA